MKSLPKHKKPYTLVTIPKLTITAYKLKPNLGQMTKFKASIDRFQKEIFEASEEREDTQKLIFRDLLRDNFGYQINVYGEKDLAIKEDGKIKVIIESKRISNKNQFCVFDKVGDNHDLNKKGLHELVLYYFRERFVNKNLEIKHLIVTNQHEFFIITGREFDRFFATKEFQKEFELYNAKDFVTSGTDHFYDNIAKPIITKLLETETLEFTYFDIRDYFDKPLEELVDIYKIFCPEILLKKSFGNDSNSLDEGFYKELLYIMGLEELKDGKMIQLSKNRQQGSLLEDAIYKVENYNVPSNFDTGLELVITWINRVLFLKLLEGQIASWNNNNSSQNFSFLGQVKNYGQLNDLFFEVLAKPILERNDRFQSYNMVPYLNSSLFEKSNIEEDYFGVDSLRQDFEIQYFENSITGKKGKTNGLDYLLEFLGCYDFGAEGGTINVRQKSIINASVLGSFFERLNGYKDGSFYTPSMITMNMAEDSLTKVTIAKFQENGYDCQNIKELGKEIRVRKTMKEASQIFDTIRILEPSVGSGHLLVSCLNQMIKLKHDLGILLDDSNDDLNCHIDIDDDELLILDSYGKKYKYIPELVKSQNIQKTLFDQKQRLIENCLYGVDINPNSVKICQLRLWIELLKHSYYKDHTKSFDLETLPNIDINIKAGNSLISRFELTQNLTKILESQNLSVEEYQKLITDYHSTGDKKYKKELRAELSKIKTNLSDNLVKNHPVNIKIRDIESKIIAQKQSIDNDSELFEHDQKTKDKSEVIVKKNIAKLENERQILLNQKIALESTEIYDHSTEWRFEFPQVLDIFGNFVGFDLVIANPPYIGEKGNSEIFRPLQSTRLGERFYQGKMDIFYFFFHLGLDLLRDGGVLHYITTGYYITASESQKLLTDIRERSDILGLIRLGELKIFESASGQHNLITQLRKKPTDIFIDKIRTNFSNPVKFTLQKDPGNTIANTIDVHKKGKLTLELMAEILRPKVVDPEVQRYSIPQAQLWFRGKIKLPCGPVDAVLEKLLIGTKDLGKICEVNNGVHTQADYLSNKKYELRDNQSKKIGDGIYVLDQSVDEDAKVKSTFSKQEIKTYLKPFYKNSDIQKYTTNKQTHKELIYLDKGKHDIKNTPNVANHILDFETIIKEASDNYPYLHRPKKIEFELPKIVAPQRSYTNTFGYNEIPWYAASDVFFITKARYNYSLKFLLGVLNSKIIYRWLYCFGKRKGEMLELTVEPLSQIPIPTLDTDRKVELAAQIERIVEEILRVKNEKLKMKNDFDTTSLESQIDVLVYELYGLTAQDIAIIEG
jgi:adenine-specific DNA-methyltransferase